MIIGIGEMGHSNNVSESIVTHALGSCVAIVFYSSEFGIAAMSHAVLPTKNGGRDSSEKKPALYCDEAVERMVNLFVRGYKCPMSSVKVTLIGGADSRRDTDHFKIGLRNLKAIKDKLLMMGIPYLAYDTGGHFSRTVEIKIKDGHIDIRRQRMNF